MSSFQRLVKHRLLGLAHSLLQRIVPPDDRRVVFTSIPDHADNSFAVYRHLLRTRTGLHITWIVVDPASRARVEADFATMTAQLPDGNGHRLSIHSRHNWRGYLAYLRAGVAFHTHGVFAFARTDHGRHIVSMWHGMMIKAVGRLNEVTASEQIPHGTTHLATSETFRYLMATAFDVEPGRVLVTTLPRTDALLAETPLGPTSAEIRSVLGLHQDRTPILWMPTYRSASNAQFVIASNRKEVEERPRTFLDDLPPGLLSALDESCGRHRCQIVVKLHPLDTLNHRPLEQDLDNIRFVTSDEFGASGLQLYDVLADCGGLMSDVSSVVIDFVPTGRPIGLVAMPFETYERNLILPLDLFVDNPRFDLLVDAPAVEAFVDSVARGDRHRQDAFTNLLHPVHDESGCERVLRAAGL